MTEKYAVISDIHGNHSALVKVLEDIKNRGIDQFIIAGDYCISGAWPDECIQTLKEIPKKWIIRGNEERYLENLIGKDQSTWTDGQMQISYWNYRNIQKENLEYLLALPHTAEFECNGVKVHVAHSLFDFTGVRESANSVAVSEKYAKVQATPEMVRQDVHDMLDADESFQEKAAALEEGVYIFGHTHVQWSYKVPRNNILLINPGSCGLPLDAIRDSVPYAILTITEAGEALVEEIRVPFTMSDYVEEVKKTTQYLEANVWCKVIFKELLSAKEHMYYFLQYAEEYAKKISDERKPYAVETWERAYEEWSKLGNIWIPIDAGGEDD